MADLKPCRCSPGRLHEIDKVLAMPEVVNSLRGWTYWLYVVEDLRSDVLALTAELTEAKARADALFEHQLPCREAEVAQARYEAAEAERDQLRKALESAGEWVVAMWHADFAARREDRDALLAEVDAALHPEAQEEGK